MPPLAPCHCTHRYADEPPTHILCPPPTLLPLRYCPAQHSTGLGKRTPGPFNSTTPLLLPSNAPPCLPAGRPLLFDCTALACAPNFATGTVPRPRMSLFPNMRLLFHPINPTPFMGCSPRPPFHQAPWPIPADLLPVAGAHLHARWPLPVLFRLHLLCACCGMLQHTEHKIATRACHVN